MRAIKSEMESAVNVAVDWWCDIITHPRMSSHIPAKEQIDGKTLKEGDVREE